MSEPTLQTQIDAANAYEALFVPALFGQWAPKVADAAQLGVKIFLPKPYTAEKLLKILAAALKEE